MSEKETSTETAPMFLAYRDVQRTFGRTPEECVLATDYHRIVAELQEQLADAEGRYISAVEGRAQFRSVYRMAKTALEQALAREEMRPRILAVLLAAKCKVDADDAVFLAGTGKLAGNFDELREAQKTAEHELEKAVRALDILAASGP